MNARISNRPAALSHITTMSPLRGIVYWLISAPVLAETIVGAQWDLTRTPYVSDTLVHLGYPLYLLTIMGVAKVLAVAALLAPWMAQAARVGLRRHRVRLSWCRMFALCRG